MGIVFDSSLMPAHTRNQHQDARTSNEHISLDQGTSPTGYESMWAANPYANYDYRHTWWQKLKESLGFRTNYDVYKENMALNAAEYSAQVQEKAHNEEYDSPLAQARRMREAGLNPDLNNNVDSGSSSGMEPDPNAPISPSEDFPMQAISSFTDTVMSAFTGAIGIAKDGLALLQMANDVDAGKIGNSSSIFEFAMNTARQFIPSQYPEGDDSWMNRAIDQAMDASAMSLSKRQQKQFRRMLNTFYASAPTQASQWSSWLDNMDKKQDWFIKSGSQFWQDGTDETLRVITKNLTEYYDRIRELQYKVEQSGLENQEEYNQAIDPSLSAGVVNTTNRRNIAAADIDGILNECLDSIVRDLRDLSESGKKGHGLAQAAVLMFSILRMVNFSHSSGSFGNLSTSKTSFGF